MQYKFYTISIFGTETDRIAEEMNVFIRGHRVLTVQKEFLNAGERSAWSFCIEYIENGTSDFLKMSGKVKVDYRQLLDGPTFERFRILRECRKIIAQEDAVPPFAVFLDEHLAEIAKNLEITQESLKKISGIGEKKAEKYGFRFVELWEKLKNEKGGQSVQPDTGTK